MLSEHEKLLIKETWRLAVPLGETVADLFYRRLFELKPEYQALFKGDMASQKRKLLAMLAFVVKSIDWGADQWSEDVPSDQDLFLVVMALGRRHRLLYRVPDASYADVGEALLWTLDMGLGDSFTDEVRDAWSHLYSSLAATMQMGAHNSAPPQT